MVRLAVVVFVCCAGLSAQTPVIHYTTNLGVAGASAAVADVDGNVYVIAGTTLVKLGPDGSILSSSTPMADIALTCLALDAQGRVVIAGNGFVSRPPDFITPVVGAVKQVAVDLNGNIWATAGTSLFRLNQDGLVLSTWPIGGASGANPSDLVIDAAGSVYVALVTNSAELPADGFEPRLNGIPGAVSYDGGGYFYPVFGLSAAINQWLLTDSNTVYVATQGQGVNVSTDRGQTFATRNQGLPDLTVSALAADPVSSQILYAATAKGLSKSTNSGTSWSSALNLPTGAVTAIAVHPKNRAHLYAAMNGSPSCTFYRSTNGGLTWLVQQQPLCVTQFVTDPNDVTHVYAITFGGVYSLSAASTVWTQTSTLLNIGAVAVDPANFATWYATAEGGIYKSTDSGASWTLSNPGAFAVIAFGKPYVIAGTPTGGIVTSTDGGVSWNAATTAPFAQPVRSLLTDSGTIFAGATYNAGIWLGKFSPLDGQLLSSTFLGGTGSETAARLAVDGQGVVTVVMESDSTDAPTTLDAAQRRAGGGTDLVVTRLTPAFGLQYASYFGGSGDERIGSVKLDARGFLYMAGTTNSPNLPLSSNALRTASQGAFAAVLNPSANGVVYSSYADGDQGVALVPDNRGNAVFIGRTLSDSLAQGWSSLIGYLPLGAIRNSASLISGSLAPGSLITIDGTFGAVSGISVLFNGQPATIVQSRDTSMDVAVPAGATPGAADVTIQSRNGLSQGTAQLGVVAPGLFSANRDGKGVALATLIRVDAAGNQDTEAVFQCTDICVALPIDFGDDTDTLYLQLTATGLRNEADFSQFQVTVGGQAATVIGVGPQGISPGLDQLTIELPRPADGFVGPAVWNLQVTVDGKASNTVTITVG